MSTPTARDPPPEEVSYWKSNDGISLLNTEKSTVRRPTTGNPPPKKCTLKGND